MYNPLSNESLMKLFGIKEDLKPVIKDCATCEGEGVIKFKSHETEEYKEYDTTDCPDCSKEQI